MALYNMAGCCLIWFQVKQANKLPSKPLIQKRNKANTTALTH